MREASGKSDNAPPETGRRWLGVSLDGLLGAFLALVLLATVLGLLGRWHWALDLFAHQRRVYAAALTLGVLWFAVRRRWTALAICTAGLGINAWFIGPLWLGSPAPPAPGSPTLRVMAFNVHTANEQMDAVADYLAGSEADLIAVLEVNQRWSDRLDTVPGYRRVATAPRPDNFGMLILQRVQLGGGVTVESVTRLDADPGPEDLPAFEVRLKLGAQPARLLAVHPLPPVSPGYAASNRQTLAWAGDWSRAVQADGDAAIVIGDLNATPWGYPMRRMTRDALRPGTRRPPDPSA